VYERDKTATIESGLFKEAALTGIL